MSWQGKMDMCRQPNIILITIDSLRADCLSCYGSNNPKTPNIDKLAEDGILFRNAFANGPNTVTSVSSFLTSRLVPFVKASSPTIVGSLRNAGYDTIGINPNVQLVCGHCRELGLTRGFRTYDTMLGRSRQKFEAPIERLIRVAGSLTTRHFSRNNAIYRIISSLVSYAPFPIAVPAPRAREINKKAISCLEKAKQPFFLWLFYLDVHEPYLPPQEDYFHLGRARLTSINRKRRYFWENLSQDEVQRLFELYKMAVEGLDREIGLLIQVLKEKKLYENAVIFFTADHGEQFREHGGLGHPAQLYDEQLHVPLLIKTGAGLPRGLEVKEMVSLLDLAPTVSRAADIECNENFTGQVLPFTCNDIFNEYRERPVVAFGDIAGELYCYRKKDWKFICSNQGKELYNLRLDPGEKNSLYREAQRSAREAEKEAFDYLRKLEEMYERAELEERRIRRLAKKLKVV